MVIGDGINDSVGFAGADVISPCMSRLILHEPRGISSLVSGPG